MAIGVPSTAQPIAEPGTGLVNHAWFQFLSLLTGLVAQPGMTISFAGATLPTGWLKCNGALVSRATYSALFAAIGSTYGAGDGSTTFALPNIAAPYTHGTWMIRS